MAIKRLTNIFFSEISQEQIRVNGQIKNGLVLTTNFPFTLDQQLALYRPMRSSDAILQEDGTLALDPEEISSNGIYSNSNWFIGLSVNNQVVWNGIPASSEEGYVYFNNIAISSASFIDNGRKGRIEIDLDESSLSLLDVFEIAVIKANIWTPWIYYGNIPERQQIAYEVFDRSPRSMGGIPESLTPSQAVGYRYFVDFSISSDYDPVQVPTFTPFFLPTFSPGSSLNDQFFMGDILDGNGEVAARSACSFKILSISENQDVGGTSVQTINIINTGAFRTINYSPMEYQSETYDNNKILTNTNFYITFKQDQNLRDVYANLSETLRALLGAQIDFDSCNFRLYSHGTTSVSESDVIQDSNSLADGILNIAEKYYNTEPTDNYSITNIFSLSKTDATSDFSSDITKHLLEETNSINNFNKKYVFVVIGDLQFSTEESLIGKTTINTSVGGVIYSRDMSLSSGQIIFNANEEERGTDVLGPSTNQIFAFKNSSVYGFQFVETLAIASGFTITENDLFETYNYLNYPAIKAQCNRVLAPRTPTSTDLVFDFGASDIDGDGIITFIDRIYELYSGFNPAIDAEEDSFFGSRGVEMRYWRRMCPIGGLFDFVGQIETIENQRGNNYLCTVKVLKEDGEYVETDIPNNVAYVYFEDGATINVGEISIGDIFNFKGRLFFPKYFYNNGNGISLGSGVNLSNPDELVSWYRIGLNTAEDLLDYARSLPEDPIIVIRSNIIGGTDADIYPHGSGTSINPFNQVEEDQFFAISQSSEKVQDSAILISSVEDSQEIVFTKDSSGTAFSLYNSDFAINFYSIEFDIKVDDPGETGSLDNRGLFQFAIDYRPVGDDTYYQIAKFWSAEAFFSGGSQASVKIDLSVPQLFGVQTLDETNKFFNITFPYGKHPDFNQGIFYYFDFIPGWWDIRLLRNGKKISHILSFDRTLSEDTFEGAQAKISPEGYVVLQEALSGEESLFIEFTNIAGNQRMLKSGNELRITLENQYSQSEGEVTISNIKINNSDSKSIERVDVHYSNRTQSAEHFIAPAFGFAVVSDRGWNLNQDDANNTAGGAFSTRITGFLESPQVYFDAFSNETSKKTITATSSRDLPAIDIIYSNMVSVSTQPFVELFSVGYTPPPPEALPRSFAHLNEDTGRFVIFYNKDNNIIKKESINYFRPKSSIPGYRDNVRWQYPIMAGLDNDIRELPFEKNDEGYTVNISGQQGQLVGLKITTDEFGEYENFKDTTYYSLFSNSNPLGYEQYSGEKTPLVIPVRKNRSDENVGWRKLPDTSDLSSLELVLEKEARFDPEISKVEGYYVDNFIEGSAPVCIHNNGLYYLFFENQNTNNILGLISDSHSFRWKRPATSDDEPALFASPIPMVSGYNNPVVFGDNKNRNSYIFVYDNNSLTINLIVVPLITFQKLSVGIGEESSEEKYAFELSQDKENTKSLSDVLQDSETKEWYKIYSSGRKLLPIAQGATSDFSAAQTKKGTIYLSYRTINGEVKLLFTNNTSYNELRVDNLWSDTGINLISQESRLGRVLEEFGGIYSMTLSAPTDEDKLYLLIATNDSKLLFFDLPESIVRLFADLSEENASLRNTLQSEINKIKPSLIIGSSDSVPNEDLNKGQFLNKSFEKQIVSLVWNSSREGFLVFLDNGKIRALKTTSRGLAWSDYKEV